jgi:hypothetical protein
MEEYPLELEYGVDFGEGVRFETNDAGTVGGVDIFEEACRCGGVENNRLAMGASK